MVNITINNMPVKVAKTATILTAAQKIGIKIPTLCHFELDCFSFEHRIGSCRICVVEVEGRRNLAPACCTPVTEGMEPKYGFGGWGIGINSSSDEPDAAWEFIKWLSSPEIQKEWIRHDGAPIRRSTLEDPELNAEYPWFPILLEAFENGDGDYRPPRS